MSQERILVLGGSGMLGHMLARVLTSAGRHEVVATVRNPDSGKLAGFERRDLRLEHLGDVLDEQELIACLERIRPTTVINAVGVVKQLGAAEDPLVALPINALLPHRLQRWCKAAGVRLVHISTDCVFSGLRGSYVEEDEPDARDLYGLSKLLGEVREAPAITLRTSIIGPELDRSTGLLEWFLGQSGQVKGYTAAFFSGLTTYELARVVDRFVLGNPHLHGLYHVSADRIAKYELLKIIARVYGRDTAIEPDGALQIDRSLDSTRFREATGYEPPDWDTMIKTLHDLK